MRPGTAPANCALPGRDGWWAHRAAADLAFAAAAWREQYASASRRKILRCAAANLLCGIPNRRARLRLALGTRIRHWRATRVRRAGSGRPPARIERWWDLAPRCCG